MLNIHGKHNTKTQKIVPYKYTMPNGEVEELGHGMHMRTDIEIPSLKCVLELKVSTASTKREHMEQLRTYLEQREDLEIGFVVNFITKDDKKHKPVVQIDILKKKRNEDGELETVLFGTIVKHRFNQYGPYFSEEVPSWDDLVEKV